MPKPKFVRAQIRLSLSSLEPKLTGGQSLLSPSLPHKHVNHGAQNPTPTSANRRYADPKLLLKQWLKEEELILGRVSLKETQINSVRKEITNLYVFFFLFHSLSVVILFNAASLWAPHGGGAVCRISWIPSLCSLLFSLGPIWAVRYKTDNEVHLEKMLEREKEDGKLLARCVEELKKKGVEFDLLKEVDALRRAKSLHVEAKPVRKWSARDFVTLFFFSASCFVLVITRVILCD
ncbi:hypothetical protein L484_000981 [Morus notabilis]|uniref:Uncharacterized protein n=1 Tax=Morus notabilis TaxID=981085 RepID=W9SP25_9ROSA|nr:hypothetical protein L484_000981 [Morus notabilis]